MKVKQRRIHDLGIFHKEATRRGLTYAQAQIEETCGMIGPVRVPVEEDPEYPVYQKVSTRNRLQKQAGSIEKRNGEDEHGGGYTGSVGGVA